MAHVVRRIRPLQRRHLLSQFRYPVRAAQRADLGLAIQDHPGGAAIARRGSVNARHALPVTRSIPGLSS